jgi:proteasome lid subunit RPN8/RPN11
MNTINPVSVNSLPVAIRSVPSAAKEPDARAPRATGQNLASTRSQVAPRDHIPYITHKQLRDLLSESKIQRLQEITRSFMEKILVGEVGIENLMAPLGTIGETQEYLMFRDVLSGEKILIPGTAGEVYCIRDTVHVNQSRAMTEEERERFKQEGNKFDGEYQRSLLQRALTMYGYLRLDDSPEHHAETIVDNLHIHPDDCRPSSPDILGAGMHPGDLSIVMTRDHLYISLFPNRPHPTAPLKDRLNTLGIRYKGPKYIYDEESSIFRHASSAIANQENQAPEFINDLLKEIEIPTLRLRPNSKRNLKMILEEIKKQPIAAQIFKNAYESQDNGTIKQKIITALKNVIEIMNAFFLDKEPQPKERQPKERQPNELAFYLNHGSLTAHTLIQESLLLKEVCSAHDYGPALREGDLGRCLEKYFGIKIIKMPLKDVIPANLMTEFEEKKQAYIQDLFDKAPVIDLENNPYHRYYLNQYQINSFDQGLNLIKKLSSGNIDLFKFTIDLTRDSFSKDFDDLLEKLLKDHVNSRDQMEEFLNEVSKKNQAENQVLLKMMMMMMIYRKFPKKMELFEQALSADQISNLELTIENLKRDGGFLNTDFNLQ